MHPNVPVELTLRDPVQYFALDKVSDLGLTALDLRGAGLHMRLYTAAGQLLAEGVDQSPSTPGETIALPAHHTILSVERADHLSTPVSGEPVGVPARLTISTGCERPLRLAGVRSPGSPTDGRSSLTPASSAEVPAAAVLLNAGAGHPRAARAGPAEGTHVQTRRCTLRAPSLRGRILG